MPATASGTGPASGTRPLQTPTGKALLLVLLGAACLGFLVSVAGFLLPGAAAPWPRDAERREAATGPPAPLTAEEYARVLGYAGDLQPDDALVDVRTGVQAKRSNVEGVRLQGRTVYYDVLGHQSFGPLGRGRVRGDGIHVLARDGSAPFQVVIYTLK